MKKLTNTLVLCTMLAFCFCPAVGRADNLSDKIKTFNTNIEAKLKQVVTYVNNYYHSEKVQTAISEIKAEEKVVVKCVLTAIYNFWLEYESTAIKFVEAQIQMGILKLQAKIIDSLPFFKAKAVAIYESAVSQLIAQLPLAAQVPINVIRSLTAGTRAVIAQRIVDYLAQQIPICMTSFNSKVDSFIEAKLAELDTKVAAKLAAL